MGEFVLSVVDRQQLHALVLDDGFNINLKFFYLQTKRIYTLEDNLLKPSFSSTDQTTFTTNFLLSR